MSLLRALAARESGEQPAHKLVEAVNSAQALAVASGTQSRHKVIASLPGSISLLALDPAESRFLLVGSSHGLLAVYDTQDPEPAAPAPAHHGRAAGVGMWGPVTSAPPSATHAGSITAGCWYPADSGMFLTGGGDSEVRIWDAEAGKAVMSHPAMGRVHAMGMSRIAAATGSALHCTVAVATDNPRITLMDLRVGGATGSLLGHTHAAVCLGWSTTAPWQLATGDLGGAVCLWDVRRSGEDACMGRLDRLTTPPPPAPLSPATGRSRLPARLRAALTARALHSARGAAAAAPAPSTLSSRGVTSAGVLAHEGGVTSLQFLPPGGDSGQEALVSVGRGGDVRVWSWAWPLNTSARTTLPRVRHVNVPCIALSSKHPRGATCALLTHSALPTPAPDTTSASAAGTRHADDIAHRLSTVALVHPNVGGGGVASGAGTGAATAGTSVVSLGTGEVVGVWGGHLGGVRHAASHPTTGETFTGGLDGAVVLHYPSILGGGPEGDTGDAGLLLVDSDGEG